MKNKIPNCKNIKLDDNVKTHEEANIVEIFKWLSDVKCGGLVSQVSSTVLGS